MNLQPQLPDSKAAVLSQVDFTHSPRQSQVAQRLHQLGVAEPVQLIAEALAECWLLEQPGGGPGLRLGPSAVQLTAPNFCFPHTPPVGPPRPPYVTWDHRRPACADAHLSYFRRDFHTPRTAVTLVQLAGYIRQPAPTCLSRQTARVAAAAIPAQALALTQGQDGIVVGGLCAPGRGVSEWSRLVALRLRLGPRTTREQVLALVHTDAELAHALLLLYAEPGGQYLTLLLEAPATAHRYADAWRYYYRLFDGRYQAKGVWGSMPAGGLTPDALLRVWADPDAYLHPYLLLPPTW